MSRRRTALAVLLAASLAAGALAWWWLAPEDRARGFVTLPPGSELPSGDACAARVPRVGWEPRPQNAVFNARLGRPLRIPVATYEPEERVNRLLRRVDGEFTGTTSEILEWAACKWGFDEDTVRGVAAVESWWDQRLVGDRGESIGLFQVRCLWGRFHAQACPDARRSSAFNADYAMAFRRACYEGLFWYWFPSDSVQKRMRGDLWGCIGMWFSGRYRDPGSEEYRARVQAVVQEKPWLQWEGAADAELVGA